MTEYQNVSNLVNDNASELAEFEKMQYEKYQWQYLDDINNGAYSNGILKFKTETIRENWIDWHDAYLDIPLTVTIPDSAPAAINTVQVTVGVENANYIGYKSPGVAGLIYSANISGNSQQITDTQFTNLHSLVHQMTSFSNDYNNEESSAIGFAKDTFDGNNPNQYTYGLGHAAGNLVINGSNASFNEGFMKRCQKMITSSYTKIGAAATFNTRALIPLKLIHPFFDALDIPLKGINFDMNFTMVNSASASGGSTFRPFMCNFAGFAGPITFAVQAGQQTRVYYPVVDFKADIKMKLVEKMTSNTLSHKIAYTDWEYFDSTNNASTSLSLLVAPAMSHPTKIWTLMYEAGSCALPNSPAPGCADTSSDGIGSLGSINVNLGGKNLFPESITKPHEAYNLLKRAFFNAGDDYQSSALISYNDFYKLHRILHFDLSKWPEWESAPGQPVSIKLMATRLDEHMVGAKPAGNVDIYVLIEKQKELYVDFQALHTIVRVASI